MRLALIQMSQETDTFNPMLTTLEDFAAFGLERGGDVLERHRGPGTIGGFIGAVEASSRSIEMVPIGHGLAVAGGRITLEALRYFEDLVRDGLGAAGDIDGLALQLHGACSAEGVDDVESVLIEAARAVVGPGVPIVVTLDHHANLTARMVELADALMGYRTQPHDPFETAVASTELLIRMAAGEVRPTMAFRKIPLISHQEQYLTSGGPMKVWFDRARELEREPGILTISLFPMQPWLDVDEAGWATLAVTDGDQTLAERLADELTDLAWSMRAEFQVRTSIPPARAVATADTAPDGLIVLSDHGDSVFGGAAGDSTVLLETMLRQPITNRALVPLIDPEAAAVLARARPGDTVTLFVGGGASGFFRPLEVTGVLRTFGSKKLRLDDAPFGEFDMGPTAVLDVGPVTVLISTYRGVAGNHPGVYRAFGVEPAEYRMAVLKTASNFQWFAPLSSGVIRVDTPGPTQSDIASLPWARIPRPIYPLDELGEWR
jgi:microcystin degradation protein MlrC